MVNADLQLANVVLNVLHDNDVEGDSVRGLLKTHIPDSEDQEYLFVSYDLDSDKVVNLSGRFANNAEAISAHLSHQHGSSHGAWSIQR